MLTYGREARHSFFRDLLDASGGSRMAAERLEKHAAETETRDDPNRTSGEGGYFAPPLWLNQYAAMAVRPKRVFAGMLPRLELPPGVQEVSVPRVTSGAKAARSNDLATAPSNDVEDASIESAVQTISGISDWSLQALEQSPAGAALDYIIFQELTESYDAELEESLFTGRGKEHREVLGVLNLSGVNSVEFTGSKATEIFIVLGKMAAQVGNNRKAPPQAWFMRTSRWAWIGSGEDESKLPLDVPGHQPVDPVKYTFDDVRPATAPCILGWPNYLSDAIPANIEGSRDTIVLARPTDSLLLESTQKTSVSTEVLSGTLQVRFNLRGYAAFLPRFPSGFCKLVGSGMEVEEGF